MRMRLVVLTIFMLVGNSIAFGQTSPAEKNATAEEISGNWQLLPLPEALQPKMQKNPWPAQCQWFSYSREGALKSIDNNPGPCNTLSSAQLDEAITHVPAVASWKYDLSPVFQKALVIVSRSDVKGYAEYWEPHIIVKAFSRGGIDFKEGDLLLYLVNLQARQIVWIRHLRKLT